MAQRLILFEREEVSRSGLIVCLALKPFTCLDTYQSISACSGSPERRGLVKYIIKVC